MDTVSKITGTPVKDLQTVYEMYSSTGVPDKAGTIMYALGPNPAYLRSPKHQDHVHDSASARQYGHLRRRRERHAR